MRVLNFVVLVLSVLLQTVCYCIAAQYYEGCIQQACKGRATLVLLNKCIWTLLGEYGIVRVLSCFDGNPIQGLLALARVSKINFDPQDGLGWFLYKFDNFVFVSRVFSYDGVN